MKKHIPFVFLNSLLRTMGAMRGSGLWMAGVLFCSMGALHNPAPKYTAYFFLSDGCPMCQGYAGTMNRLAQEYEGQGVRFVGIFPNFYVTDSAIASFRHDFDIHFELKKDSGFVLTERFKASITPEVFLTDANDHVVYGGMIDNAYYQPGKRRGTTSIFYLKNALDNLLSNRPVGLAWSQPIGCVIVKD